MGRGSKNRSDVIGCVVGHELGNVVGCVVGHELGNVVGCVVGPELGSMLERRNENRNVLENIDASLNASARCGLVFGHGLGNVVGRVVGHAIETCTSSSNGHGNMVGRGFRNRRAIANAFATSSNTHVNQDASPALQAARQHHVKRCANSVTHDTRSH